MPLDECLGLSFSGSLGANERFHQPMNDGSAPCAVAVTDRLMRNRRLAPFWRFVDVVISDHQETLSDWAVSTVYLFLVTTRLWSCTLV
jgi:hypothetical protein